jgi:hypothetical protein
MTYFDQMAEEILFPTVADNDDFWVNQRELDEYNADDDTWEDEEGDFDDYDDSMDGDHESALASAGWGTDEDYGYYGEDEGGW